MAELIFEAAPFGGAARGEPSCGCGRRDVGAGAIDADAGLERDGAACPGYRPVDDMPEAELEAEAATLGLTDYVMNREPGTRSYGEPTKGPYFGKKTEQRCTDGVQHDCPVIPGLEVTTRIGGIPFEYIGGGGSAGSGLIWGKTTRRWLVNEGARVRNRKTYFLPRVGDALVAFIGNMRAAGMPLEAILSMGSVVCRCMSNSARLSPHASGDAIDIGGVRLVGGRDILVANSECDPVDRALLHRINACLRLSFATVLDYHDRLPKPTHWNHFHCDTDHGGERRVPGKAPHTWAFIRESLGLPWSGGFDKPCAAALRALAGPDAWRSDAAKRRTLGKLFLREALATPPERPARYSCQFPLQSKARPG